MKAILKTIIIICIIISSCTVKAQSIKPTDGANTCKYCLPQGWVRPNTSNFDPGISDMIHWGGDPFEPWTPAPQGPIPSGLNNFLSVYHSPIVNETCHTTMTGLTPGVTYYLRYNVMTTKTATTNYAIRGAVLVSNGGDAYQKTEFTPNVNTDKWIENILVFKATSPTARLTVAADGGSGGYVNFDIGFNALRSCYSGTEQVKLSANSLTSKCLNTFVNLNSLVTSQTPSGASLVWFTNAEHTGSPYGLPNAAAAGTYYAFYYDAIMECYNTSSSNAKVVVSPKLVEVNATTLFVSCISKSGDLNSVLTSAPPNGAVVRWFDNSSHSGNLVSDPTKAGPGDYYAFYYYSVNNCYNTDNSIAKVTVSLDPSCADLTPTIDIDNLGFNENVERDFVVNIYEVGGASTIGNITFRLSKLKAFDILYPTTSGTSNVFGETLNENSKWTFSENANFVTAVLSSGIAGSGKSTVGFSLKRKAGQAKGLVQNITTTIVSGSGGETNATNNQSITNVATN
ncbi:hypothetical protein [Dyadobacter luticola]|uniref:Ig-like domain-containing protein n=1 Tax=Dyadobacter luticola TaxID=1979387 RepID=A0A5R9L0T0_9BACT|nr:hypothetical protein [Dyadobacter luticola]TLV02123.1 hypothetical protein FEN17_00300 [Dyadobacter luticola]